MLGNEALQPLMLIAGLGILCWLMLRGRMKNRKKTTLSVDARTLSHNGNATSQGAGFSGTASLGAPRDVLKWQIELHDLGRALKAELDTKMIAVREITRQYELAAERLAAMIKLAEQLNTQNAHSHASASVGLVRQLHAAGKSVASIASELSLQASDVQALLDDKQP